MKMPKEIMNKLTLRLSIVLSVFCIFIACKKELSVENGGFSGTAQGELIDLLGNCKSAEVRGTYTVDTPLNNSTNFVNINVNFTSRGKYKIYSDTVNGMWFIDSGFTVTTGTVVIKLKGYGTPILPKTTDFALIFNNTLCGFSVPVSGSGGVTGTSGDYFPTTSGSSWVYEYLPKQSGATDTFTVRVAQGFLTVDGINYAKFGTPLQDTFYFSKDGAGNYYALSTVDFDYTFLFESVPPSFISYPFLKESVNVGDPSWSTPDYGPVTSKGVKGTAKAVFTVVAKNIQYKSYNNVINVKREIMFKPDGGSSFTVVLSGNSYYAKGFGLIDQVFNASPVQSLSLYEAPVIVP
jgi:hypothetical protein